VARPEGLEPPTYRFEVRSNTESQGTAGKRGSVFLGFGCLSSLPFPAVLAQSGHNVVTNDPPVDQLAYRFIILRSLNSYGVTTTCKGLRPACDHSPSVYPSLSLAVEDLKQSWAGRLGRFFSVCEDGGGEVHVTSTHTFDP